MFCVSVFVAKADIIRGWGDQDYDQMREERGTTGNWATIKQNMNTSYGYYGHRVDWKTKMIIPMLAERVNVRGTLHW